MKNLLKNMIYKIVVSNRFKKEFSKLDKSVQRKIDGWIKKNLLNTDSPRIYGKTLVVTKKDYWRYRIGNYRIIAKIEDETITISLIEIGHRKDIYSQF